MGHRRPNIVFILVDDMGYGDIGAFGNDAVHTPHLDRLAAEGVRFTQHYSGSCMCAPARAALLTGKYPHRVGAIDVPGCRGLDRIALRETTIADLFRSLGYATGAVGKWHNGSIDPRYHPNARGFGEFAGFCAGIMNYWDWVLDTNGTYYRTDGRYLTDVFTEEAVQFVGRHHDEPFLLYLAYNAPHLPLEAPEDDVAPFREIGELSEGVCRLYGMNRAMDRGVGRILEALERHGVAENTIVVFTSDNGPRLSPVDGWEMQRYNGYLNGSKGSVLEGGIRVPAIVSWPAGLGGGRRVDELVHFTDWLPTLLAAAGEQPPRHLGLDGEDVLPLLRGEGKRVHARRFWQWNRYTPVANCNAAMRDGRWKLVRPAIREAMRKPKVDNERTRLLYTHPEKVTEIWREPLVRQLSAPGEALLYDLDSDPYEAQDVADAYPRRVRAMQQDLDRWFESVLGDFQSIPASEHMELGSIPEGIWSREGDRS